MPTLQSNQRIRVLPKVVTRIERSLQGKGKINVQIGQQVEPQDILGQGSVSGGFRKLNLAQLLGENPVETAKYLQRQIGQRIYKGELLAYKPSSLFKNKKVIISPTDGIIDFYSDTTGQLSISFLPKMIDLPAAVYGIVESFNEDKGQVIIKTEVTNIFGVVGSGRSRDGILQLIGGRGDLLTLQRINPTLSEHILAGGSLIYNDAISSAISLGVRGIITGGVNAKDYRAMAGGSLKFPLKVGRDMGISLIASEGFGSFPMGEDIYNILQSFNGRFIIIDGNRAKLTLPSYDSESIIRIRNTALPKLQQGNLVEMLNEVDVTNLAVGQKVRVIAPPFAGEQGSIIAIDKSPTLLEAGIRSWLVLIETKSRKIAIPHPNIEVII